MTSEYAARALASSGKRPNTALPEPDIAAPSAPLSSSWTVREFTVLDARASSTSSNTLYMRCATPRTSPRVMASIIPFVSGWQRLRRASMRPKSSGVEQEKCGMHMTTCVRGSAGSAVSFSPRPSARAAPPMRQYGTSLPASIAAA